MGEGGESEAVVVGELGLCWGEGVLDGGESVRCSWRR